jgi:hypothetical protein
MDARQVVEMNEPDAFFEALQPRRTQMFVSQILH